MRSLTPEERKAKIDNIIRMLKELEESAAEYKKEQSVNSALLNEIPVSTTKT